MSQHRTMINVMSIVFAGMLSTFVGLQMVDAIQQTRYESAFDDALSSSLDLLPVVFLVLAAAVLVSVISRLTAGDDSSIPSRSDLPTIPRPTIETAYPFPTTGVKHTVDVTTLVRSDYECVICGGPADGELRRWRKDLVVLGMRLWSFERGTNCYCEGCTDPFSVAAIGEEAEISLDPGAADGGDAE